MIQPTQEKFAELSAQGFVVPVYRELPADLETPLSVFLKLRRPGEPAFLLESVEKGQSVGRYSFLGTNLSLLLRLQGDRVELAEGGEQPLAGRDPLELLRQAMGRFKAVPLPGLHGFWGGAVGFLGYDAIRRFEPVGPGQPDDLGLPEALFHLCRQSVLFDHVAQRMYAVVAVEPGGDYQAAVAELNDLGARLARPLEFHPQHGAIEDTEERHNQTREEYMRGVERIREHIAAGDIFQAVLSRRLERRSSADPVNLYRALRILNPSPYMFFLDFGEFQLIGSSPEALVKLDGRTAETHPIAGTRPRGRDVEHDHALEQELLADPKERAEHVMLVDLGRNDLGRVCSYGSVHVPQFMEVERFSHVMHIVSRVQGELRPDCDGFDLVRAAFPAGTVSGAPKIRAMQILDELEPTRRGIYAGAVGYFGFWGNLDTCIAIRTILRRGDRVYLQAGAGIVADSDPATEYQETVAKLEALKKALEMAEGSMLR
ncbi:MAG: anthranilate synthase component I [Candidatus Xenobia bacterium]